VAPAARITALTAPARRLSDAGVLCAAGVVQRRLQIVNIVWGPRPSDAVGMHVAAWVLGESLMHWAGSWTAPEARLSLTCWLFQFKRSNVCSPDQQTGFK
jgi:hypothetical protein